MSDDVLKLPLASLKADPDNARRISDEALAGLSVSVEEFGDLSGIVWNERTGELVCGHQRVTALRQAGATTWHRETGSSDRAWLEHPKTHERFPIRVVDWDPTRQRMANLVANNTAIAGEFTSAAVEQLKALEKEAAFESLRLGELEKQLAAQVAALAEPPPKEGNTDPDAVPDEVAPVTKPGDLWIMGEHRLLCGDSTKAEDVARVMADHRAVLMNTDPPYGVAVVGGTHDPRDEKNYRSGGDIENDDLTGPTLQAFLERAFRLARSALRPGAAFYVWYADTETSAAVGAADVLGGFKHVLVWVKPHFVFGRSDYHYRHEPCLYGWTPGAAHVWLGSHDQSSVFEAGRDEGSAGMARKSHPTVKPVALFETPMRNHTRPGEVCYEPFAGSGSQVIAAERLGRRCFAMELSPAYCDVIVARWERYTGRRAVRADAPNGGG